MKKYLYVLCLMLSVAGLNSCSKNNDPTPEPVVGTWKLDRIRTSGFAAPYTAFNADNDPTVFDYQDSFTTKTDKTFTGTQRSSGVVLDYNGNWEFTNNTLTLKDDKGNEDKYTLDATKTPPQLLSESFTTGDSLTNPTTKKLEFVRYNVQLVYTKQ